MATMPPPVVSTRRGYLASNNTHQPICHPHVDSRFEFIRSRLMTTLRLPAHHTHLPLPPSKTSLHLEPASSAHEHICKHVPTPYTATPSWGANKQCKAEAAALQMRAFDYQSRLNATPPGDHGGRAGPSVQDTPLPHHSAGQVTPAGHNHRACNKLYLLPGHQHKYPRPRPSGRAYAHHHRQWSVLLTTDADIN